MSWFSRLRNALSSRRLDEDLADEIADHLERRAAALREEGLGSEEARRRARLRFGNATYVREESRAFRLSTGLEGTLQDLRYAWRGMRKAPAFAATAVVSLALAIGANTAIYSLVDAAVLRPLPVAHPEQLFRLSWPDISDTGDLHGEERDAFSYPEFLQYVAIVKPDARLAFFSRTTRSEAQAAEAPVEKINKAFVSGEGFDVLGVSPASGRLFNAADDRVDSHPGAILSYGYWRRRFHSDPRIVGQWIKLDGQAYEIVGVAHEGFFGVEPGKFIDVWLPPSAYDHQAFTHVGWHWVRILGRLRPGVSPEQIQARLQPSFHHFQEERVKLFATIPALIKRAFLQSTIQVHPAPAGVSEFRKTFSRPLWMVFGVAAGILLIACANLAGLLLARSTARAPEMAMRVSLGAGRTRLIRQMLTESLALCTISGVAGWLFARLAGPLLANLLSVENDPVQFVLAIDTRVLLFCIAVSTASALLFGSIPAWQASGVQPVASLHGFARQAGKLRLGKAFVSVQVACAFCLVLVGAAFLFSLFKLLSVNPGFDARDIAVLNITTDAGTKPESFQRALMFQLQTRVTGQPGVRNAALAWWPIFTGGGWSQQVILPGKGASQEEEIFYRVSPAYFATMHTPLLAGRDFAAADSDAREPSPAIVNAAFANKYFSRLDVIGQQFSYAAERSTIREVIVGIASDAHYYDLRTPASPIVYLPIQGSGGFTLYVRSPLKLGTVARVVEREAQALGSGTHIREMTSLEAIVGDTVLREKLLADIGGAFAFFGLLLAAIGLFGLLSYSVGRRTREIGIRATLGAQRIEIVSLILKEVTSLLSIGLMTGFAAALGILALFRSLLFGVQKADPLVITAAVALFLATAFLAAYLPARRAATIDPMSALRQE